MVSREKHILSSHTTGTNLIPHIFLTIFRLSLGELEHDISISDSGLQAETRAAYALFDDLCVGPAERLLYS